MTAEDWLQCLVLVILCKVPCPDCCRCCAALIEEQDTNPATDHSTVLGAGPQALQQGMSDMRHHEGLREALGSFSALPQPQEAAEAAADGWDFEESALDGLGGSQPSQAQSDAASRKQYSDLHEQPASAPAHAGELCIIYSCPKHQIVAVQPHGNVTVYARP